MNKTVQIFWIFCIFLHSIHYIHGDENCLGQGIRYVFLGKYYTTTQVVYATELGLVNVMLSMPGPPTSPVTTADGVWLAADGTVKPSATPSHCAIAICLFSMDDAEIGDRLKITIESTSPTCSFQFWIYAKGITQPPPIYAVEGVDVRLPLTYAHSFQELEWYQGGLNESLILTYNSASGMAAATGDYHADYLQGDHSVGMILMNATTSESGNYTVLVKATENILDFATTSLTVITRDDYETFAGETTIQINDMEAIKYGASIPAVDAGILSISTNVSDQYGSTETICTQTMLDGTNTSCGLCTTTECQFSISNAAPADLVLIKITIDELQGSLIEFHVLVKAISPLTDVSAVEECDVVIPWIFPLPFEKVEWFDDNNNLMMTYDATSENSSIEAGYDIEYLDMPNSIGMILHKVSGASSGNYTVQVTTSDNVIEEAMTSLQIIPKSEYDAYIGKASIISNSETELHYGEVIPVFDPGNISLNLTLANDYGQTNTTCSHVRADGSSESCGECNETNCMFDVFADQPADRIIVSVEVTALQGSLFEFIFICKGISEIENITVVKGSDASIAWTYPSTFTNVKWLAGDASGTTIMLYRRDTDSLQIIAPFDGEYINASHSIGLIIKNVAYASSYTVKVTVTSYTVEVSTTELLMKSTADFDNFKSETTIAINSDEAVSYGSSLDVQEPGDINLNFTISASFGDTLLTCSHILSNGMNSSCGECSDSACLITVTNTEPADRILVTIEATEVQGSELEFIIFIRGISPIPEVLAVEGCDAPIPWTYSSTYEMVEWYDIADDATEVKLMSYSPSNGSPEVEDDQNVEYLNGSQSIGMTIQNASESQLYRVKLTLSSLTIEWSDTNFTVISASDYEDYKDNTTMVVNGGKTIHYTEVTEVDAGNVEIEVTVPDTFGDASVTCSRNPSSGAPVPCGQCTSFQCSFTVSGTKGHDELTIDVKPATFQCEPFQFVINVKEKKKNWTRSQKRDITGTYLVAVCDRVDMQITSRADDLCLTNC